MATGATEGRSIVRTESVLGGDPRIDGTRIGVHHVVFPILDGEYTIDQLVSVTYPDLSEGDVLSALHYYAEHRAEVDAVREDNDRIPEGAITGPDDLPADHREG
jgi:uncharacterized protein (DUF433 family)